MKFESCNFANVDLFSGGDESCKFGNVVFEHLNLGVALFLGVASGHLLNMLFYGAQLICAAPFACDASRHEPGKARKWQREREREREHRPSIQQAAAKVS
jgi:hypothetical protein